MSGLRSPEPSLRRSDRARMQMLRAETRRRTTGETSRPDRKRAHFRFDKVVVYALSLLSTDNGEENLDF